MTDTPKKPRLSLPLVTAVLLVPAFGGGLLVGGSFLKGKPPVEEGSAESIPDDDVATELSSCRRELSALPKVRTSPAPDAQLEPADGGALEPAARVEALKARLGVCRKSEVLINARICSSVGRHFAAMMALPDNGVLCIQRTRAAMFIEEDFDKCDDFEAVPSDLDTSALTKEELATVMDAVAVRKSLTEDELAEKLRVVRETCFDTAEKKKSAERGDAGP